MREKYGIMTLSFVHRKEAIPGPIPLLYLVTPDIESHSLYNIVWVRLLLDPWLV